jgi:hypothetical protein
MTRSFTEVNKTNFPKAAPYPNGARFVFTILDDTDDSTRANVEPIYDLLYELGFRTTKTVWPNDCDPALRGPFFAAETLRDPDYLDFVHRLVERGFEIALHNTAMGSSLRHEIVDGLEFLRAEFGYIPTIHCNHATNRDNLYWGPDRYRSAGLHMLARLMASFRRSPPYEGAVEGSPYFWGDLCLKHIRWVRGHAVARIDTSNIPPGRPYKDPTTPWVARWFTTSAARNVHHFRRLVTRAAIDRLVRNEGICILSTHLGKGFVHHGKVERDVEEILRYVARLPGWFAPVSQVLEHLEGESVVTITPWERLRLELAQLFDLLSIKGGWRNV